MRRHVGVKSGPAVAGRMEFVRVDPPGCDLAVVGRPATRSPCAGTLVFIHGLGGASSSFAQATEAPDLARFDLLLVDLLGHGASDKPENFDYRPASHAAVLFQALRAVRHAGPVLLVGYSLGGAVAVELARFPVEGIAGVILVEPSLDPARMPFAAKVAAFSEGEFRAKYADVLAPYAADEASEADRHWVDTAAFASSSAVYRSAKGLLEAAKRGELWEHLRSSPLPRNLILSPQTLDEWPKVQEAKEWGSRIVVVESASRSPMYDNAQALYAAIGELASASGG